MTRWNDSWTLKPALLLLLLAGVMLGSLLLMGTARAAVPQVRINDPPAMSVVEGLVNLTGNASDDDGNATLQQVELRREGGAWTNSTPLGSDLSFWYWHWDSDVLVEGFYTLQARAYDGESHSAWYNMTLRVDRNEAPQVGVALANNSWVNGTLDITGSAQDPEGPGNLSHIELSLDDDTFSNPWVANGTSSWYYRWDTRLYSSGEHQLYVRALDKGGLNSTPLALTLTINQRPQLTLSSPITRQGWVFTIDYQSQDTEGDLRSVALFAEPTADPSGRLTLAPSLGASGSFQWNCSGNASGPYVIYGWVSEGETGQSNRSADHPIDVPLIVVSVLTPGPGGIETDFETPISWRVEGPQDDRQTTLYLDEDTDGAHYIEVLEYLLDQQNYTLETRYLEPGDYYLRIRVRQQNFITDIYTSRITVAHENTAPSLEFTAPVVRNGWLVQLHWDTTDQEDDRRNVTFLADPGGADEPIPLATGLDDSGSYTWNCSQVKAGNYDIIGRVTDALGATRDQQASQRVQVPEFLVFMTNPAPQGEQTDERFILNWRIETAKSAHINVATTTLFLDNDTDPDNGNTTLVILLDQTSYVWDLSEIDEGSYYIRVVVTTGIFSNENYSGPLKVVHFEQTLKLVNLTYLPELPRAGVRLEFTSHIHNPGSGDARLDVQYTLDGVNVATHDVYITAKGTATDIMSWTAEAGQHTLRARLIRSGEVEAEDDLLLSFRVTGPVAHETQPRSLLPILVLVPLTLLILVGALIITNVIPVGRRFGFGGSPPTPPAALTPAQTRTSTPADNLIEFDEQTEEEGAKEQLEGSEQMAPEDQGSVEVPESPAHKGAMSAEPKDHAGWSRP